MRSAMVSKPPSRCGRHLDLDDGGDLVEIELVLVQDGLVAADDAALLVIGNALVHFGGGKVEHAGDVLPRFQRVGLQNFQQFVHNSSRVTCAPNIAAPPAASRATITNTSFPLMSLRNPFEAPS